MRPQIVNVINFIRAVEPRDHALNLLEPVARQIELLKKYKLPASFLIQYDALMQDRFVSLLKSELNESYEIGGWLEIVQPLVEKAGLQWRGRPGYSWDWHADVTFTIGYTPEEREKLVDIFMADFKKAFGYYPESVGSWIIDAHTLKYLADKYNIVASCNCRDQWGTDGYTLWGGYYNQAYYPSSKNVLAPAQNRENQIPVPVFRMLGSDPIYQYDAGLEKEGGLCPSEVQPVVTLEPVYPKGGGSPEWVDWYFKENFNGLCLSFGYTQVGQENSFGWEAMRKGLTYQIALLGEKTAANELRVETLRDSGKWFKSNYTVTPASAISALSDWKNQNRKSVWYCSRFFRVNFFWETEGFMIRDLFLFDESYSERYLMNPCTTHDMIYNNLPIMDGNRWSRGKRRAGIYLVKVGEDGAISRIILEEPVINDIAHNELELICSLKSGDTIKINCSPDAIEVYMDRISKDMNWALEFNRSENADISIKAGDGQQLVYKYNNYEYLLKVLQGNITINCKEFRDEFIVLPQNNKVRLGLF